VVTALAIYYPGLIRVKCKSTGTETLCEQTLQGKGLFLAGAMTYYIIGVSLKLHASPVPFYPYIKGIVQEQVRQKWAYDSSLRSANPAFLKTPVTMQHRGLEPSFYVQTLPLLAHVLSHCPHEQVMIYGVKE
jgi:hypothetical protein